MANIGIILSGCGVFDGAEIHESVLTLLAIDRLGHKSTCIAPNIEQMHVINHINGELMAESRNVLTEAARLARGQIQNIRDISINTLDALILPGGFGAAKNLSDFAINGQECSINSDVQEIITAMHKAQKPIGFACIAPVIAAKVLGNGISLTIGTDPETTAAINSMGANHQDCEVKECIVDEKNKIVSTPAYMLAQSISEVEIGISSLVEKVIELLD